MKKQKRARWSKRTERNINEMAEKVAKQTSVADAVAALITDIHDQFEALAKAKVDKKTARALKKLKRTLKNL